MTFEAIKQNIKDLMETAGDYLSGLFVIIGGMFLVFFIPFLLTGDFMAGFMVFLIFILVAS